MKSNNSKINILGHRGYKAKYPENTFLSFQKAIDAHADYIELDVHLTSDQEIVVCHDGTTGRVGNKNLVIRNTPLAELKTVDMGKGEKIPTLQEVFDLCKGKIGVQIEIKHEGCADKVVPLIEKNGMIGDVLLSSFVHSEMARVKELNGKILTAVLEPVKKNALLAFFATSAFIKDAKKVQANAIHPFVKYVNKKFVEQAHNAKLLVNPWTVDDPTVWKKIIDAGVDGIITNDPEGLYKYLEQK